MAELKKEGESGRRTITKYTRWGTLILGLLQASGIAYGLPNMIPGLVDEANLGWQFVVVATISLTTGTMFLMWLGEQITERGIGNGISLLILLVSLLACLMLLLLLLSRLVRVNFQ